jgi:hypothetical protein
MFDLEQDQKETEIENARHATPRAMGVTEGLG